MKYHLNFQKQVNKKSLLENIEIQYLQQVFYFNVISILLISRGSIFTSYENILLLICKFASLQSGFLNDIDKQYATIKEDITNNDIHYINIIDNAIVGFKYFDFSRAKSIKLKVKGKTGHINIRQDLNGEIIGGVFLNENIEEYNIPCNFKEIIGPLYIEFIDTYDTKFFEIEIIS